MSDKALPTPESLRQLVETIAEEHPPISLDAADLSVRDRELVRHRFGPAFAYLSRVELEVERNVLELRTMLPRPPEVDRLFYEEVWAPQELQHGVVLAAVQSHLAIPPPPADLHHVSGKIRVVGVLSHLPGMDRVVRLLYYLTGAATERAAVLAYTQLHDGLVEIGEKPLAATVLAPIRRQEPAHFAFYRRSAQALVHVEGMRAWELHLARVLRRHSFGLVGANTDGQQADLGAAARALGLDRDVMDAARQISLVEREVLWARREGMEIPDYVVSALRNALDLHTARTLGIRSI